jgi:hypothetical protein
MSVDREHTPSVGDTTVDGKQLLETEWQIDLENAAITKQLLESGQLGKRAPEIYANLGRVVCILTKLASCRWGCRRTDHDVENLCRRCCNYAFAALNLLRCGFYDESLCLIRSVAEVVNLMEIFAIDPRRLQRWKTLSEEERRGDYGPGKVRKMIEESGKEVAVGKGTYSALSGLGTHVTPESIHTSHHDDGRVHVGASFSVRGFLVILNELAINLSAAILFAGYLLKFPKEQINEFREACNTLRASCNPNFRPENYQEMMREMQEESSREVAGNGGAAPPNS